jgi:hypothetical protein
MQVFRACCLAIRVQYLPTYIDDARSNANQVQIYSIIAVTNKHTAKLHHVGSLYMLIYDARKIKHKINNILFIGLLYKQYAIKHCFNVRLQLVYALNVLLRHTTEI